MTAAEPDVISADDPRPSALRIAASVVVVGAIAFVLPVLVTRHYHALGIVRNDDWSYLRTLFTWVDTGHLDFNNWVSMTLLMQLVFAAPIVMAFGHNVALIQLQTAALGFGGLCCVLWMGFTVTRRLWIATFAAALVAVGPLWGALAVSYMTDVPAFAVSMLACALGMRAFKRATVSLPFLAASMFVGLVGFTIRQYAAVPPIAVALVGGYLLWHEPTRSARRIRNFLIAAGVILVGAIVFWAYWRTIPHPKAFTPAVPSGHSLRATLYKGSGMVRLVGLLLTPALVMAGPLRIVRRSWAAARDTTVFVGLGTVAVLVFTGTAGPNIGFAGNYITPSGILAQGVAAGHRPDVIPSGLFTALLAIATISSVLLALSIVPLLHEFPHRWQTRDLALHDPVTAFLGLVVAGYCAAYLLASLSGIPLYDRYVLPVIPIIAILLFRPLPATAVGAARVTTSLPTRGLVAGGMATLLALAFIGLVFTADSASFDGTRWKVATEATRAGWARPQIRGGFEWSNFYIGVTTKHRRPSCVAVVLNPPGGLANNRIVAHAYYHSLFIEPVLVAAVRSKVPCTPRNRPRP
jgi:hypothetical protein